MRPIAALVDREPRSECPPEIKCTDLNAFRSLLAASPGTDHIETIKEACPRGLHRRPVELEAATTLRRSRAKSSLVSGALCGRHTVCLGAPGYLPLGQPNQLSAVASDFMGSRPRSFYKETRIR